ncbi:MAG: hypothetical protein H0W76_11820 [Pyrinomonadaceae bacterium]|nr:hypothetical protein [Pyrinomonadaceae bacterium]
MICSSIAYISRQKWRATIHRVVSLMLLASLLVPQFACSRPLPPAGKNTLVIRGQQQDSYFYPAANGIKNAPKVLFLCGDGGWNGFALDIAAEMARSGYDVYSFDTKRYLESFTTDNAALSEQDVMNDLAEVAKWMQTRWRERITLVGWSEGAGLVVCAARPTTRAVITASSPSAYPTRPNSVGVGEMALHM